MAAHTTPISLIHELAALERDGWLERLDAIPAWHPRNEGEPAGAGGDGGDGGTTTVTKDAENGASADTTDDDATKVTKDDDWQSKSRKHETRAKRAEKRLAELEAAEAARTAESQTEHERAVEAARAEARAEADTEHSRARRTDKLEVQVVRLAAGAFADPDDALVFITRAVDSDDLDLDDLVDADGKVNSDALKAELDSLLKRKPHMAAGAVAGVAGGADQGEGAGSGGDLESQSIEDHMRRQGRIK